MNTDTPSQVWEGDTQKLMTPKRDGYSIQVTLPQDDIDYLKEASEKTGLNQSEIMRQIAHAGLKAIAEEGFKLVLPLKFCMLLDGGKKNLKKAAIFAGSGLSLLGV